MMSKLIQTVLLLAATVLGAAGSLAEGDSPENKQALLTWVGSISSKWKSWPAHTLILLTSCPVLVRTI